MLDGLGLRDLAAFHLRLDQLGERGLVAIIEACRIERALLGLDDVLGKLQHLALNLDLGNVREGLFRAPDFIVVMQGGRDHALAVRADEHRAQTPEKHRLRQSRDTALAHPVADQRIGVGAMLSVWRQKIGLVEVDVVDLLASDESAHCERLVALRHGRRNLLGLQHDVFARRGLIALHLLFLGNGLAGLRVYKLTVQFVPRVAIDRVERHPLGGGGSRVNRHGAAKLRDLQKAFPVCPGRHQLLPSGLATQRGRAWLVPQGRQTAKFG